MSIPRFSVDIVLKGEDKIKIPTSYRKNITSLIKQAINPGKEKSELYEEYYGNKSQNKSKPFTFSVVIPPHKVENHQLILDSNIIRLFFSSNDYRFIIELYNGLININHDFSPFAYPIDLKHFHLERESPIDQDTIKFKTLSPIVLRNVENKKGRGYLTFEDEKFKEMLFYSTRNTCQQKENFSKEYELDIKDFNVNILSCETVKIDNYKETIPATNGIFEITAPIEVLQLIYGIGLGARRSQGFGMVEVIR
jgi:CRISPR-associated endoribonuclease Cas6